jgi:hypothetical protein
MTIWQASLDSRSFSFEAYGSTEERARAALHAGLQRHAETHQIRSDWYVGMEIETRKIEDDDCFRGPEKI